MYKNAIGVPFGSPLLIWTCRFIMTLNFRLVLLPLLIAVTLTLAGCKSAEEKAEDYYQSGLALMASGDDDRALVEFRNTFKYNGFHKEARQAYAGILIKQGKVQEAYSQYLRLIEQYPDTPDVRQVLAEIAIGRGDWVEAERHGLAAIALTPNAPGVQAIKLALDYRKAVIARDEAARSTLAEAAETLLKTLPENLLARRITIDRAISGPNPITALPMIDAALTFEPKALEFHMLKFRLLAQSNDIKGTGDQLKAMFALFPDNTDVKSALIGWYLVQKDLDGAEAFLRQLAGDATAAPEGHLTLVQFLQAARSPEVARAELQGLITANAGTPNAELYGALDATLNFEAGQTAPAITAMEGIVKSAAASDQTRRIKAMLARMLDATENRVGARALVEEILAEDPSNVDALKLRAGWFIAEDKPGDAIVDLRAALDQTPRDAAILTLMAAAHERDGSLDLAGERLALAVEVSGAAPDTSLRYAQFLMRQGRPEVAETVLTDARRTSPADPAILRALAEYYIGQSLWPRADEAVDALAALNQPEMQAGIQGLRAAILSGQNRIDDSLALLQEQVASGDQSVAAAAMIVQTQVRAGKVEEARAYLDGVLKTTPKDPGLRILSASLDAMMGKADAAEAQYRSLLAEDPTAEPPLRLLYGQLAAAGREAEATAALDAGLKAAPKSVTLRWMKAGELERGGDIEGAIAVYDALYAEDSSNTVVANNLASLITAHHDDAASLARAEAIARRLRGSDVPAFQDTYGWIAFRRGNTDEALAHLEPAAKGLPQDALTQYHLGLLYAKLGRADDAKRQFTAALAVAGDAALPQMVDAQKQLDALKAATP